MSKEQKRPEFIPLGYDSDGRVVDVMGYVRDVEAIPYALDKLYVGIDTDGSAFDVARTILEDFRENTGITDELKKLFDKDLEGKVGFIVGPVTTDDGAEGVWRAVQFYRVKD